MATKTENLIERCKELGIDTESLKNNEQRKTAIDKVEAELTEANKPAPVVEAPAETKTPAKKEPELFYEDERKRKWVFKADAPKKINIDGHPMSQKEILETEDVISELVYGNSNLITQKQN